MLINLKDQIVVLDEAHNIEDSAREAASVELTSLQFEDTKKDLQDMSKRLSKVKTKPLPIILLVFFPQIHY